MEEILLAKLKKKLNDNKADIYYIKPRAAEEIPL